MSADTPAPAMEPLLSEAELDRLEALATKYVSDKAAFMALSDADKISPCVPDFWKSARALDDAMQENAFRLLAQARRAASGSLPGGGVEALIKRLWPGAEVGTQAGNSDPAVIIGSEAQAFIARGRPGSTEPADFYVHADGATEDEALLIAFARACARHAHLTEGDAAAALSEPPPPAAEPVAWRVDGQVFQIEGAALTFAKASDKPIEPLYTAPQPGGAEALARHLYASLPRGGAPSLADLRAALSTASTGGAEAKELRALRQIKKIALTLTTDQLSAGLARITRLCIDAGATEKLDAISPPPGDAQEDGR